MSSRANDDADKSTKSNITSSASSVDVDTMNFVGRPRRFYIDDILSSDFGQRCLEQHRSVGSEFSTTVQTVADTPAGNPMDYPMTDYPVIVDRATLPSNGAVQESDKCATVTTQSTSTRRSPSSSVTSSRRFHGNRMSTDSATIIGSRNSDGDRRTALKDGVKMEPGRPTDNDVTARSDTTGTICDVTSSTSSPPFKADGKDHFTLPAWVYCTRYSDRPSAGNGPIWSLGII